MTITQSGPKNTSEDKDHRWYWSGVFFALGMSLAVLQEICRGQEPETWMKVVLVVLLVGYSFASWYAAGGLLASILLTILNNVNP